MSCVSSGGRYSGRSSANFGQTGLPIWCSRTSLTNNTLTAIPRMRGLVAPTPTNCRMWDALLRTYVKRIRIGRHIVQAAALRLSCSSMLCIQNRTCSQLSPYALRTVVWLKCCSCCRLHSHDHTGEQSTISSCLLRCVLSVDSFRGRFGHTAPCGCLVQDFVMHACFAQPRCDDV